MKLIYVVRARCSKCKLDKMHVYYRPSKAYILDDDDVPHVATPSALYEAHKNDLTKVFKDKYYCEHDILFTKEIDKDYKWDEKLNKPVLR